MRTSDDDVVELPIGPSWMRSARTPTGAAFAALVVGLLLSFSINIQACDLGYQPACR